jgi:hypothetical protein
MGRRKGANVDDLHHHPDGDDRYYGKKEDVFQFGIKPLIGILLAILALPLFLAGGLWAGLKNCAWAIWKLGDDFYYWSKVHYWGKYTPRYRRRKRAAGGQAGNQGGAT